MKRPEIKQPTKCYRCGAELDEAKDPGYYHRKLEDCVSALARRLDRLDGRGRP